MKKKYAYITVGILICIIIIFIVLPKSREDMPNIVFSYDVREDDLEGPYEIYMIDKRGNVYYSKNVDFRGMASKLEEMYISGEVKSKAKLIKTIDISELESNFTVLRSVVKKGNYKLIEDPEAPAPTVEAPYETWYGNYYSVTGNVKNIELYFKTNYELLSKDERSKELADWISEVCNIK